MSHVGSRVALPWQFNAVHVKHLGCLAICFLEGKALSLYCSRSTSFRFLTLKKALVLGYLFFRCIFLAAFCSLCFSFLRCVPSPSFLWVGVPQKENFRCRFKSSCLPYIFIHWVPYNVYIHVLKSSKCTFWRSSVINVQNHIRW